jgi:hypothetical protein
MKTEIVGTKRQAPNFEAVAEFGGNHGGWGANCSDQKPPKTLFDNIRQYMSYKIGSVPRGTMYTIPNNSYIGCATSPIPKTSLQMQPTRLRPDQLPDPWLLDSNALLAELARIRDLALRIPATRTS